MIGFYFYRHYFYVSYHFCYKSHLLLLIFHYPFVSFKKVINISNYYVSDCFIFFFEFNRFLTLLITIPYVFRCFFLFLAPTTTHIGDTCWFTLIFGCICFKNMHSFVFNTTHCLLWG